VHVHENLHEGTARAMVVLNPGSIGRRYFEETAQAVGYPGAITVRASDDAAPGAFTLDFGDGSASFDPAAAAERVSQALHAALAAEGLHAEPLIPGTAADADTQSPES